MRRKPQCWSRQQSPPPTIARTAQSDLHANGTAALPDTFTDHVRIIVQSPHHAAQSAEISALPALLSITFLVAAWSSGRLDEGALSERTVQ